MGKEHTVYFVRNNVSSLQDFTLCSSIQRSNGNLKLARCDCMAFIIIGYDISLYIQLLVWPQLYKLVCLTIVTRYRNIVSYFLEIACGFTLCCYFFRIVLCSANITGKIARQYNILTVNRSNVDI